MLYYSFQSLENLSPQELSLPVPERIGMTMKRAGVSITVTSITDIIAFFIGFYKSISTLG